MGSPTWLPPTVSSVSPNSGTDGRRDGGDDHGDELCRGSDGDVRGDGGDQCGGGEQYDRLRRRRRPAAPGAVTVTVTVQWAEREPGQWIHLYNDGSDHFRQVASATPQSPTATVAVTYPAAQTAGDLNVVVVGWNDTTATVQSVKDSAGNNYSSSDWADRAGRGCSSRSTMRRTSRVAATR